MISFLIYKSLVESIISSGQFLFYINLIFSASLIRLDDLSISKAEPGAAPGV
jgi:hypothetical protein